MKKALLIITIMLLTVGAVFLHREHYRPTVSHSQEHDDKIQLKGKVISIADGDTITVIDQNKEQHKIRLAEIDAPEKKQAFGTKAKEALADKVFDHEVTVKYKTKDRYGRIVGYVYLDNRLINKEMVEEGFAWQYTTYSKSKDYGDLQAQAKKNKVGLWKDESPTPPWEFRKKK